MSNYLDGLRVLITGVGSGLGRGLTLSLLKNGALVGGVTRNKNNLEDLRQYLQVNSTLSSNFLSDSGSMMDGIFMQEFVNKMSAAWGGIDLLIANAGVYGPRVDFDQAPQSEWEEAFLTNTLGLTRTCRVCLPALKQSKNAQILVVGSAVKSSSNKCCSAYASSKAMYWSFTRCLSAELAKFDIAVNELIPGPVNTSMNPGGLKNPLCRSPEDAEFVGLISYLYSFSGNNISGQSFSLRTMP